MAKSMHFFFSSYTVFWMHGAKTMVASLRLLARMEAHTHVPHTQTVLERRCLPPHSSNMDVNMEKGKSHLRAS